MAIRRICHVSLRTTLGALRCRVRWPDRKRGGRAGSTPRRPLALLLCGPRLAGCGLRIRRQASVKDLGPNKRGAVWVRLCLGRRRARHGFRVGARLVAAPAPSPWQEKGRAKTAAAAASFFCSRPVCRIRTAATDEGAIIARCLGNCCVARACFVVTRS